METNLDKYKMDIKELIKKGAKLLSILTTNDNLQKFRKDYEIWYSESLALIKVVLPDRIEDFQRYYDQKGIDSLKKYITYTPPRSEGIKLDFDYIPAKEVDHARVLFENQ